MTLEYQGLTVHQDQRYGFDVCNVVHNSFIHVSWFELNLTPCVSGFTRRQRTPRSFRAKRNRGERIDLLLHLSFIVAGTTHRVENMPHSQISTGSSISQTVHLAFSLISDSCSSLLPPGWNYFLCHISRGMFHWVKSCFTNGCLQKQGGKFSSPRERERRKYVQVCVLHKHTLGCTNTHLYCAQRYNADA